MSDFTIHPGTHIGPVHLIVSDLERALGFYRDVLGLEARAGEDGATELWADGGAPLILLTERPGARPKPPRTTGLYHYAILLPTRRELAHALRRLMAARYPIQGAADHLVSEALYLADPDGNGIEMYADRPREEWQRRDGEVTMSTEALDAAGLMAELEGEEDKAYRLPGGTRIGHIHLHVSDLVQARAFYCDVLGFELITTYPLDRAATRPPDALFVAAGGYHHHIGLNIWAGAGAPPPPPDAAGLHYFTICLPDAGELRRTVERLRAAGVPLEESPGGVFLQDPSENRIRLAG
jgi:catechol 2,3-dioxygenase